MEQNNFFIWLSRINSIIFLLLLLLSIGFVVFGLLKSNQWNNRNTVEVMGEKSKSIDVEALNLGQINEVCGTNVKYIELDSRVNTKGFSSSGGYNNTTRNIIFFVGEKMDSHWLFETNRFFIKEVNLLKKKADDCNSKKTVSIYYEVIKNDTNDDGQLDNNDDITIALTSPDGLNYTEIQSGISSVIDHSVDDNAETLTILMQKDKLLIMQKYLLKNRTMISEKEISRIGKKL